MVIVIIYLEEMYKTKYSVFLLSSWYSQSNSMVNVFGDSTAEEGGLGIIQVLRKAIAISGKYGDYVKEIQASQKLGYPASRVAPEGSPTFVFTYENKVSCLGVHNQHIYELTLLAVTKTHHLAYWTEDSSSGGNTTSIKGDRGIQGKRGATGGAGPIGPHGPKEVRCDIGPSGGAGVKGDAGPSGPKGEIGIAGVNGKKVMLARAVQNVNRAREDLLVQYSGGSRTTSKIVMKC